MFSEAPDIRITVEVGSPIAEIFLIDHTFALVRRSVGDLETTVAAGIYKVKARLADAETERLVVCDRNMHVDLSAELSVSSPAPLSGASGTSVPEVDLAQGLAEDSLARPETYAEIMLVTRWSENSRSEPFEAYLHHANGTQVAFPRAIRTPSAEGQRRRIHPGHYFLRWEGEPGSGVEQAIYTVAGWQTQVFVLEEAGDFPDLGRTRVSVLMSRTGFDPDSEESRRTEELRTALADERNVASAALDAILDRYDGPMLGLLGAHIMLLARDARRLRPSRARPEAAAHFNQADFDGVVGRLRDTLGPEHPDVVALSTQAQDARLTPVDPIGAPPMLWRSWMLLLEASNDDPTLVPADVWRRAAAPLPLRPFLIWSRESEDAAHRVEEVVADVLARAEESSHDIRRDLTDRLLVPRAVIDARAEGG